MQFTISVINVDKAGATTAGGKPYTVVEVAYKENGQIKSKKLMPFPTPNQAYKAIHDSKAGDVFTITAEKNDKGFWTWNEAVQQAPGSINSAPATAVKGANVSPKSTYETPEERAKKQVFIVKQSSVSSAIALLSIGAKSPPPIDMVLDVAKKITSFVFDQEQPDVFSQPNDLPEEEVQ